MAFLDKLKKLKGDVDKGKIDSSKPAENEEEQPTGFLQLDIDVYQTSSGLIIYAPVPGSKVEDIELFMGEEGDIITIQGRKSRMSEEEIGKEEDEVKVSKKGEEKEQSSGKWLREECEWGQFYRQIILPQEIDVDKVNAKLRSGVLVLKLPFLSAKERAGRRIKISGDKK